MNFDFLSIGMVYAFFHQTDILAYANNAAFSKPGKGKVFLGTLLVKQNFAGGRSIFKKNPNFKLGKKKVIF
jgi:hypothetical protein